MLRGIYTAAMGMLLDMSKLDVTANNLANVETVAYKRDKLAFRAYQDRAIYALPDRRQSIGNLTYSAVLDDVFLDSSMGTFMKTDNPMDFAIDGEGFFSLLGEDGVYYSRAGNFKLNEEGYLVNTDGLMVLDENNQPIRFESSYVIDADGYIRDLVGNVITRLGIYNFDDPGELRKIGYTLFQPTEESGQPVVADEFRILSGYVELSNVNAIDEMVNLIEAQRHFEISQKALTVSDETLAKLISQVGSLK
ncbi:MAG: flagellar basal-body rod protein FlgF [Pseudothermotoga sp.]|uniref:flagellar basal-body rod protein FlgF n=1 Tax=Pseudothermotoga TaxID=1643951 RepID=UPI00074AFD88|nr:MULTISPECIES: flagellar basal-body rod protein FlgF [Pseudothermotoga]KUK21706.1 MAG: Uncharacterized protein XD56_0393 [Pseudothermotoga lettingae]MDI3495011.1 flagellar basal-body rod protein FlgF [Pseudothermotoga sp.]MDK2883946.1 flagellar basal-body rod protein FlgF [Pseudothermotoga sp.]HBJ82260.1 flagellar basal-body rod protein FlgF [Pseudothermotoga sp.]HBT25542.1 flagellar basal-body rod protein FlgF [Pseudothermotoga sp.]